MITQRGVVYTFYSFKGGVGRSMALANVAALLSKREKSVLVIDWDLEAPGLEKYFSTSPGVLRGSRKETCGVVDLIGAFAAGKPLDWRDCLLFAQPFKEGLPVSILTAGKDCPNYVTSVQSLDWNHLFDQAGFGGYLEQLREEWVAKFDFVLVDSRTGITDIGGICTIHLPDILVLLFTANEQSLEGVADVVSRAKKRFASLPFDRSKLLAVPVPSRFENVTEYKLAAEWKRIFADRLSEIYKDWLPDKTTAGDILEKLFIPYIPFWSFGEGLPVVKEGTTDPRTLGFAYDLLARLLEKRLQWSELLQGDVGLSSDPSPQLIDKGAESIFESLSPIDQEAARQVLTRLVRVGRAGEEDGKRRVPVDEFDVQQKGVIDKLLDSRLLFEGVDSVTKERTVEISQEGLVRNWERLSAWIDQSRDFLLWRNELALKASEWNDSDRDNTLLLDGASLGKAERIIRQRDEDLNIYEKEFIRLSSLERARRKSQELRKRTLAYVPYALLGATVLASMFSLYASRSQIAQQRAYAEAQRAQAELAMQQSEIQLKNTQDQIQRLNAVNAELLKELLQRKGNSRPLR